MGILIAIDGVDASGKETQSKMLYERLRNDGIKTRIVSFPAYDSPSSALVKMYLNGEFGTSADDVNAYAASSFYAADRFATFKKDWGRDYQNGTVIVADRYVSSNMIHQAGKLNTPDEQDKFLSWLRELEHRIYGLPEADMTVFLDMPVEWGAYLMKNRSNKITGETKKDIHECDIEYLKKSYENASRISDRFGWERVKCAVENGIRSAEDIHEEVYGKVIKILGREKI